jgi:hypothetical protein
MRYQDSNGTPGVTVVSHQVCQNARLYLRTRAREILKRKPRAACRGDLAVVVRVQNLPTHGRSV